MERIFVVPAKENSIVRYPGSDRILAIVGGYVPKVQYWTRRVADKDVLDCTAQKQAEENPSPKLEEEAIPKVEEVKEVVSEVNEVAKDEVKKSTTNKKKKSIKKS